jgi:hypothetical protein
MTQKYINKAEHMTLNCDICINEDEFDGTFQDCIDQAKRDGWSFKKHEGEWYHFCSAKCRSKL